MVFSLNVTDKSMSDYIAHRAATCRKGLSGYLRDLVLADWKKWKAQENIRQAALDKLTPVERKALGFDQEK
jgi:hypothetical protein